MGSSLRGRTGALLVLSTVGLSAVLFPGALLHGEAFFERDLHLDWYPRLEAIARSLRGGSWPVWDPSVAFGQPLLADPGAQVAYPGTWLVLLAPRPLAYTLFVVLHLALTAVGAFRLGRAVGAGRAGAVAGTALWLLSGPLQSAVNLWHHFAGACWMPWLVLAVDRAARRPGARTVVRLGATGALQALAGSADACVMSWAFALAWAVSRRRGHAGRARLSVVAVAGGATLALGLSAVAWRPAADVLSRSPRRDLPEDIRTAWSLPPHGLLRLVVPLDPARVPFEEEAWRRLYDRPAYPFLFSLYLGLPTLALGAAAVAWRTRRARALVLLALALLALGFALGPHGPVYPILTGLAPPLRVFRYPSKALLLVALATSLAAGLGVGALARRGVSRRVWGGLGLGLLAASAGAAIAAGRYHAALGPSPVLAAAVAALLVLHCAGLLRARVAALAVTALAAADLLSAHAGLNPTVPAELVFRPPPLASHVDRREGRRLYVYDYHSLPGTAERLLGRPDPYRHVLPPAGWDPRRFEMVALRLYLPPPAAGLFGLEGSYDLDIRGLYPRGLNDLTFLVRGLEGTPAHAKLLRAGAVGTVASLHTKGLEDLRPAGALASLFPEPIRVWHVPGALPRSWVVGCSRSADRGDALRALADPSFDPAREVILPAGGAGSACGPAGESRVALLRTDRVRLDVEATAPGFVVLADAWDPGWQVTVDEREEPLLRANVAFRAVRVPAGRHAVEMRYRPGPALEGLALSLASLLAVAAIVLRARWRRR
jgi:hypothetical protein